MLSLDVVEIKTGRKFTVYGINGPAFLIYDNIEGCWMYRNVNDFVPVDDDGGDKRETNAETGAAMP